MPALAAYLQDVEQAMSIKYNNMVYEMRRQGQDIVVMSLGEAFFDIPLHGFDDLPFPDLYHYSHSRGIPDLREKLARYYGERYSVSVDAENEIIVTAGAKAAIHMALMSVMDAGDEAIIFEPAWVSYEHQVRLCHGVPVSVPYYEDVRRLENYLTPRTKVMIVNNPHNPTGKVLSRKELERLVDVARGNDIFVLSDEAYSDFLLEGDEFVSLGVIDPQKEHSIICNSMSKNYGMSGWRIGYAIANAEVAFNVLKVNQHLITCPPTILAYYLARHFDDVLTVTKPQIQEVVGVRRRVLQYMDSQGVSYMPGVATFYIFASIEDSALGSEAFCDRLLFDYHVCCVPGIGYGRSCDKFIRVSVGTESMERMKYAVRSIRELINETKVTR